MLLVGIIDLDASVVNRNWLRKKKQKKSLSLKHSLWSYKGGEGSGHFGHEPGSGKALKHGTHIGQEGNEGGGSQPGYIHESGSIPQGEGGGPLVGFRDVGQNPITPLPKGKKWIGHLEGMPRDTLSRYSDGNGNIQADRQILHKNIMHTFLDKVPEVSKDKIPVAVVMMDGPASGKSTYVDAIDKGDFVRIDPDAVKEHLPEYKKSVLGGARDAAAIVHNESSYVARQIRDKAMQQRKNIIFDGTGTDKTKYIKMVQRLKENGYNTTVVMTSIPEELSVTRAKDRARITGRYVPEHIIRESYKKIPMNFPQIAVHADAFQLYDNAGKTPRLVWQNSDEGEKIYDESFVQRFKPKKS